MAELVREVARLCPSDLSTFTAYGFTAQSLNALANLVRTLIASQLYILIVDMSRVQD